MCWLYVPASADSDAKKGIDRECGIDYGVKTGDLTLQLSTTIYNYLQLSTTKDFYEQAIYDEQGFVSPGSDSPGRDELDKIGQSEINPYGSPLFIFDILSYFIKMRGEMSSKFIVVAGGVISGTGKGVSAASIGLLLRMRGHTVTYLKFDPYLNVNAGIIRPSDHGECF